MGNPQGEYGMSKALYNDNLLNVDYRCDFIA